MNSRIIPPKEKYLWKFIDLFKLLKLLQTKELYFSCLNDFDDLYEFTSEAFVLNLKEAFRIAEIPSSLRNSKIDKDAYLQKEHDLLKMLELLKIYRMDRFVNCFYSSDDESLAMWQLYSGMQGVAIRFSSESLLNYVNNFFSKHFPANKYSLTANYVKYKNIINVDFYDDSGKPIEPDISFNLFKKDIMYKHENEYRMLIFRNNSKDEKPVIKIDNWDNIDFDIFVFSDLENWKVESVQDLLNANGVNKKIKKSEIITKKIIDKYKSKFVEETFKKLM